MKALAAAILFLPAGAWADTLVAVAANFKAPAQEIAAAFEIASGHEVALSFGPSGEFYTQIENGAPFAVLLSADTERPAKLEAEGLGVAGSRFTYARGKLVLWSTDPNLVDAAGGVLSKGGFRKIAIADPKLAPYGAAAIETMQNLHVLDVLQPKIVQGNSIGQAQQFVSTGNAELGFVALSQVINDAAGSRWLVPAALYTPIDQQAVLLKSASNDPIAVAYLAFLKSPAASEIIRKYGYDLPP